MVSESALVYMARHRNLMLSLGMLALQIVLSLILIEMVPMLPIKPAICRPCAGRSGRRGADAGAGRCLGGQGDLLSRLLGEPLKIWRWTLLPAIAAAIIVGVAATQLPEWAELALGIPAILGVYLWIIWRWGFGPEDRVLFKR